MPQAIDIMMSNMVNLLATLSDHRGLSQYLSTAQLENEYRGDKWGFF